MDVIAIAVVADNGVIGDGEDQPFKIKADWARFKRTTMGHVMIMGRPTFEAMGLLEGRTSVIVSRDPVSVEMPEPGEEQTRAFVVGSPLAALDLAEALGEDRCFVCGGGQIYAATWEHCDELDLTEVHASADGDVRLPPVGPEWVEVAREERAEGELRFDFVRYRRVED